MLSLTIRSLLFLLLTCLVTLAQKAKPGHVEEFGYLGVAREHVAWPSPESLIRDLRAADENVRLKALRLLGATEQQAHENVYGPYPGAPSPKVIGQVVVSASQIELRYAALGEDATQAAILAVQAGWWNYAAVAVPKAKGWERIAVSDCGRYGNLRDCVEIRRVPGNSDAPRFELVLRASDGGSGLYVQDEAHFRLYRGELHRVISFVSRRRSCPMAPPRPCEVEARWFGLAVGGGPQYSLVEARGKFEGGKVPQVVFSIDELEIRYTSVLTCREYNWDEKAFRYEPLGASHPCQPRR